MKKIYFAILAATALFAGCSKEMKTPAESSSNSFSASIVAPAGDAKTTLDTDFNVFWADGDQIVVNGVTCTTSEEGSTATFVPEEGQSVVADNGYEAYYCPSIPASIENYDASSARNLPMYAKSETNDLQFHNVCAVLAITPVSATTSVTVSSKTEDTYIAGDYTVVDNSAVLSANKSNTVTLTSATAVGKFYVAVAPGTYQLEITAGGETNTTKSAVTVAANTIYPVTLTPKPQLINLSESGKANCYIVSSAGYYKFDASVKGGSTESVGTVASAAVLWESFGTSTAPAVGDLVQNVSYNKDGYIYFNATSAKGNAVIAAKDASGNILWSWHIWMTDQPEDQVYNNNAGTMMDRNLGATSATPGEVSALGLLYQWGRKDPFLGGSQISYSRTTGQTKAASTLTWPAAVSSNADYGTISYAVSNPTTFIKANTNNRDWYYTGSTATDDTRWQASKGLYDPCPAGYRVPDGGLYGVWKTAFGSTYWLTASNWDSTNMGMDFATTDKKLSDSAKSVWYPASGSQTSSEAALANVGVNGYYWSCTPFSYSTYYLWFYKTGAINPQNNTQRANGQPVRCLKQ